MLLCVLGRLVLLAHTRFCLSKEFAEEKTEKKKSYFFSIYCCPLAYEVEYGNTDIRKRVSALL